LEICSKKNPEVLGIWQALNKKYWSQPPPHALMNINDLKNNELYRFFLEYKAGNYLNSKIFI
jgi:hypothetical protein